MIAGVIWLGGIVLVVLIWFLFRKGGYKRRPPRTPSPLTAGRHARCLPTR